MENLEKQKQGSTLWRNIIALFTTIAIASSLQSSATTMWTASLWQEKTEYSENQWNLENLFNETLNILCEYFQTNPKNLTKTVSITYWEWPHTLLWKIHIEFNGEQIKITTHNDNWKVDGSTAIFRDEMWKYKASRTIYRSDSEKFRIEPNLDENLFKNSINEVVENSSECKVVIYNQLSK